MDVSYGDELARAVLGDPAFTGPQAAAAAGMTIEDAHRLWRAMGFPPVADDERVFTAADVDTMRALRRLVDSRAAEPEVLIQLTRVTGQSLARIADAQVSAGVAGGGDPATVGELVSALEPLLGYVWRRHLVAAALRGGGATAEPGGAELVVGFADLVGFTAFSQRRDPAELAAAVDRFESLAYEHIPERGGRVVKMIGDEVMFAVDDPVAAAAIALALVEAYGRDPALPGVRVGLARGPVLAWQGDLYGPTVNLASRLVNLARAGTVLACEALGAALRAHPAFGLRRVHPEKLKGIGKVRMWMVREKAS